MFGRPGLLFCRPGRCFSDFARRLGVAAVRSGICNLNSAIPAERFFNRTARRGPLRRFRAYELRLTVKEHYDLNEIELETKSVSGGSFD
jgi:hypothetical protein